MQLDAAVGLRSALPADPRYGLILRIDPLAELHELLAELAATEVGMEDGGGVDEVEGLFGLTCAEVGQRQAISRVEPQQRAGRRPPRAEPVDIFGQVCAPSRE